MTDIHKSVGVDVRAYMWYIGHICIEAVGVHTAMSSSSTPAKTVSFSPLRPGHVSFKNTLDNPIKLKWY